MKITEIKFPHMIMGPGSLSRLGAEAARTGQRALLVAGKKWLRESGLLEKIVSDLRENGLEVHLFEGTEPNPKYDFIDRGGREARDRGCDLIIGIGGGSVMDASKGIALVAAQGGSIWDYVYYGPDRSRKPEKALKIILVPTTAATSSESNSSLVVSNPEKKQKMPVFGPPLLPTLSIVDPELTLSLSPELTALGAVDTLCHVIEPYLTSREPQFLSDRIATSLIETALIYSAVAVKKPDDIYARTQLSYAASLALSPFPRAMREGGLRLHWIEHVLSGHYDSIPHARGLSLLLIPWLRRNIDSLRRRLEDLSDAIFGRADADFFVEKLEEWLNSSGLTGRLRDFGVREEDLEIMASDVEELYRWGGGDETEALEVLREAF